MKGSPTIEELRAVYDGFPVNIADVRAMLARVPASWEMVHRSERSAEFRRGSVQVIVSLDNYGDGGLWVHASCCGMTGRGKYCLPSWDELKRVKHDFLGADAWAYQVFPPPEEYVNDNPYVLHLYGRFHGEPVLPDFTRGLGVL